LLEQELLVEFQLQRLKKKQSQKRQSAALGQDLRAVESARELEMIRLETREVPHGQSELDKPFC
jgi:hypothetical protein